jgi:hypothetical protein
MILFVIAAIMLAFIAQRYMLARTLEELHYDNWPSRNVVEPNESFYLVCQLRNEKKMPELFLQVSLLVPKEAGKPGNCVNKRFYILPRRQLVSRTPLSLPMRGRYIFRGATVMGGDFFGIETRYKQYSTLREVVVLPERTEASNLKHILSGFLGDLSAHRFILPDPVLTIGVREYTGCEPMKDISWKHSARNRQLMVKQYDYTAELTVTVILNMESPPKTNPQVKECCFSLARRVCEELECKRIPYGFQTNTVAVGAMGMWNRINDGQGPQHLSGILEGLGRGTYESRESFTQLAERSRKKAGQGRAFVVITPVRLPEYKYIINRLHNHSGINPLVLVAEEIPGD